MYHEMKAAEILDQQAMMEPKKIKRRNFRKFMNNSVDMKKDESFRENVMRWQENSSRVSAANSPEQSPE